MSEQPVIIDRPIEVKLSRNHERGGYQLVVGDLDLSYVARTVKVEINPEQSITHANVTIELGAEVDIDDLISEITLNQPQAQA